jgi:hypothetical protein
MDAMKKIATFLSYLFHPLIMPSLGLLLLLNSGTYLSLLDPAAKRAILFVMVLGTLVFPLMMLPILYYRNLVSSIQDATKQERLVPQIIILILYVITFVYFNKLPLSRVIHAYVLSSSLVLLLVILLNLRLNICFHSAALGGLTGLIITVIFLYETPLQGILMLSLLAGGLTGSSRIAMGLQKAWEILLAYVLGISVVLVTILIY